MQDTCLQHYLKAKKCGILQINTEPYKSTTIILDLLGVLYVVALCGHFIAMYLSIVIASIKYVEFCRENKAQNATNLHSTVFHLNICMDETR